MLKATVRTILVTTLLAVGAVTLQGCAYDPYAGAYVPYAYPAYGYYPYPSYYYAPPLYGSVEIGGAWGWDGHRGWGGRYGGWHR